MMNGSVLQAGKYVINFSTQKLPIIRVFVCHIFTLFEVTNATC